MGRGLNFWWIKRRIYSSRYKHLSFSVFTPNNAVDEFLTSFLGFVSDQADSFQRQGRQLRRKMWLQNLRLKLMILGIILVVVLLIVLVICGGFKC